ERTWEPRRLTRGSPTVMVGGLVVLFWVACALFASHIAPHDPIAPDVLHKLRPPSRDHLFGTDSLGRDVMSRVIHGARGILVVAPLATLFGTVLGTSIGLVAGYFRGVVEEGLMRITDAFLAIPLVISPTLAPVGVIFVIGLVFAPIIARTVRAAVLTEAGLECVQAAKLRKERGPYVMFVEILPNVLGPVFVEFTVRLGYAIFATATLSFIGFGIQPPAPDWGLSIFEQYSFLVGGLWWPTLFPALAIASLVVAVNLVADGLNHALERW